MDRRNVVSWAPDTGAKQRPNGQDRSRFYAVLLILVAWLLTACTDREPEPPSPTPSPAVAAAPTPVLPATASPLPTAAAPAPETPDSAASVLPTPVAEIPVFRYRVIEQYPHDPLAFTQGLIYEDGQLYEGTGRYGQSTLRRVELESGAVAQVVRLGDEYFGEGITLFDDRLFQLTWTSRVGFVYDRETFELLNTFTYATEGWGLTHDGKSLIMSDGSHVLYYLDPETFAVQRQVAVFARGEPVTNLNELEYIDGTIYANIWQTDWIAQIDPASGEVVAWIDLRGLFPLEQRTEAGAVLNGIAYDAGANRLFVTGKLWPELFWIELVAATEQE